MFTPQQYNNIPMKLAAIVGLCDMLIEINDKERAADALAFVIAHAVASTATRERAEDLFDELEAELCPRVIWDARERAKTVTLAEIMFDLDENIN
jgi:hypothetical protein